MEPGTGPFSGGTSATVRGSGFDDSVQIHIGGIAVQPGQIKRDGKNRITIVVPAGQVGPADIEVTRGDTTVVLPSGFVYSALAVSPHPPGWAGSNDCVRMRNKNERVCYKCHENTSQAMRCGL